MSVLLYVGFLSFDNAQAINGISLFFFYPDLHHVRILSYQAEKSNLAFYGGLLEGEGEREGGNGTPPPYPFYPL